MRSKPHAALFLILLMAGALPVSQGSKKERYAFRSTYVFENEGEEAYAVTEEDATLVLFPSNRYQAVSTRNATHAVAREFLNEDKNLIAIMDLPEEIPAGASIVFSIEYVIESEERSQPEINLSEAGSISDVPSVLVEGFCSETETFSRNKGLEELARSLADEQTTVLGVVASMIGWIVENIEYSNFEVPLYPDETLDGLEGDCDDQSILLISMLRSVGIPAILQIGVVFNEGIDSGKVSWEGHLTIRQEGVGWHGWALVYVPPWGWIPVDLTLSGQSDPMKVILESPQYEGFIVTAFNVSRQPYIGGSRRSRDVLISSDIFVTVTEKAMESSADRAWMRYLYVGVGAVAGVTFVMVIIYVYRLRQISSLVE